MKKIISIVVIGILLVSGCGAIATQTIKDQPTTQTMTQTMTVTFSPYQLKQVERGYAEIQIKEATDELLASGKPVLPMMVKHIEVEFGAQNIQIHVQPLHMSEYELPLRILPSPEPVSMYTASTECQYEEDESVYASIDYYPGSWYSCHVACGLNKHDEHVTHVPIHIYPVQYSAGLNKIIVADELQIILTYEPPNQPIVFGDGYDMVIITPKIFEPQLKWRLIPFKNNHGVNTFLKVAEEIYEEYEGRDKPEQIKYFIKDAIEQHGVTYVLLVGGLKSYKDAYDKDDCNQGSTDWHLPVRYTNINEPNDQIGDPGFISDVYFADIYKEGGEFEDWDSSGDGIFAAWYVSGGVARDKLDLIPDVYVGRLPVRNRYELTIIINKIIQYEKAPANPSWFNKVITITGDSFQDQQEWGITWDTKPLPDGDYTIYAQATNLLGEQGPVDEVHITLDKTFQSSLSFLEDDHLRVDSYPAPPIAEITSPSSGDILGYTDVEYTPTNAYSGSAWANVVYEKEVMTINGKSYNPQPYGNWTTVDLWIKNSNGDVVFEKKDVLLSSWIEGDWTCGDKYSYSRCGVEGYVDESFEVQHLWTSNGEFSKARNVLRAWNQGSGFVFHSGHGSPYSWSQHNPGIPGGRANSSIKGLSTINPFGPPFFSMNRLINLNKLPVVITSLGCHLAQFNVTLEKTMEDGESYWTYGVPAIKCWAWYLTSLPKRGAIATIANTGIGYAWLGGRTTVHGSGYFGPEFLRLYFQEDMQNVGQTYGQTMTNYIVDHGIEYWQHVKMMCEWHLIGDPSLLIGGYS